MKLSYFAIMCMTASVCYAQAPQPAEAPIGATEAAAASPQAESAAPAVDGKPIGDVLADWAAKHGVQLVIEPNLKVAVKIESPTVSFEAGLDSALTPYNNIVWRKLFIREKMDMPQAAHLAAMMRTMNADEAVDMIVKDQMNAKISSFVKDNPVPKGLESKLSDMKPAFNKKIVYVVFSVVPTWASAGEWNLKDLVANPNLINENTLNEQMCSTIYIDWWNSIAKMPLEEGVRAKKMMGNILDYVDAAEYGKWTMEAWKYMDNSSPQAMAPKEKRSKECMELDIQNGKRAEDYIKNIGKIHVWNADGHEEELRLQVQKQMEDRYVNMVANSIAQGEPVAILSEWAKRFGKTLIVDSSLVNRVIIDPNAKTLEQGLTNALKPYPNVGWRKIYLRAKIKTPKPERLVAMVRTITYMEATGLLMVHDKSHKMSSFVKSIDVESDYEAGLPSMNPPFDAAAIYVVYNARPDWATTDGLNLLDVTADPGQIDTNSIPAAAMSTLQQRIYSVMGNMDDKSRALAMKGILEAWDHMDARAFRNMSYVNQVVSDRMTPEEIDLIRQQSKPIVDVFRDGGVPMDEPEK